MVEDVYALHIISNVRNDALNVKKSIWPYDKAEDGHACRTRPC